MSSHCLSMGPSVNHPLMSHNDLLEIGAHVRLAPLAHMGSVGHSGHASAEMRYP